MPLRNRHATRSRARLIADLRRAIDCLPLDTREAMLNGVRDPQRPILAGAYTDGRGGACPMLAAHRRGGRTDFLAFALAWDRFAGVRKARRATPRELGVLIAHLEASLLQDAAPDLARAVAEHRKTVELRRWRERREARRAERDGRRDGATAPRIEVVDPRGEIRARQLRPAVWGARKARPVPA
ncbi:MAG TPA: hypothetical protein VMS02_01800 [Solirubrobacteraceae bacterium]|nr:hypothetical protein [Solirubrobacteraceae bacterium]